MSNAFHRPGYEESVLYSDDEFEPYGYASPALAKVGGAQQRVDAYSRFGPYEREIEAAVLRRLETYPGC